MGTRMIGAALFVLASCLMVMPAAGATASELLQKAIYTEETVGNLEEAMKLYEQVIAEGQAGQAAAAQAQFRLALCFQKKGQDAEAKAAFEAVVKNFSNETELVAQARKHLSVELKLLAAPWKAGERQQMNIALPSGLRIGTSIYMVDDAERDGKQVTRCSTRGVVTVNDSAGFSEVFCQTESFAPLESLWKQSQLGEAHAVYGENSATVNVIGQDKTFTIDFTPPAFDNEQCAQLFRRLPLAEGFKTTLTVVTSLGGSAISLPISVSKVEKITVPAGTFECYRMEIGLVNQTFWISRDEHRYIARFAAGGMSAELVKVWQVEPGKGEQFDGDGFSVSLPVGWLVYDASNPQEPNETNLQLLDPRAEAMCEIAVRPKSELQGNKAQSTKAWTESYLAEVKNKFPDIAVNKDGLVETKVGGHAATQMVVDFTEGGKKMRALGVAVFGDEKAATLQFKTEAAKFDELRGAFDEIVKNFKID